MIEPESQDVVTPLSLGVTVVVHVASLLYGPDCTLTANGAMGALVFGWGEERSLCVG